MKTLWIALSCLLLSWSASADDYEYQTSARGRCVVELQAKRGRVLDTFRARACETAFDNCEDELNWRQRSGRNPYAQCVLANSPGRGGRDSYVLIDEVHFKHRSTSRAIQMCRSARLRDRRCTSGAKYTCSDCSEISHSDHSSYLVYSKRRTARRRTLVDTFHYYHKRTAEARNKCVLARKRMRECSNTRRYECTPCTQESHTDHSEFSLYSIR